MSKQRFQFGCENPDTRPSSFYKIMWSANSNKLRIPTDFKKHYLSIENLDCATLRGPLGNSDIKFIQDGNDTFFTEGWQEFVNDHTLGDKEFLIFTYDGNMCFDVKILDKNGCERKYVQDSAYSFSSHFSYFKQRLKDYNVGKKSCIVIPTRFSRMYFSKPGAKNKIVLQNSEGKCWLANMIPKREGVLISAGWKGFSDDNSLKKGDTCIFELIDQDMMKVHIFRS